MPIRAYSTPPGGNIVMQSNPVSAIDMFASAANYNKLNRYGFLHLRRRPGVNQANALLTVYTPFNKADSVVIGKADDFYRQIEEDLIAKEKGEISETEKRISQLGAGIGVVSAPAALMAAYKAAKNNEGNVPRTTARAVGAKLPEGRAKEKVLRAVRYLDQPKSKKAKAAAVAAGLGIVGIQAANTAGDIVTSRAMANAQRAGERKD